MIWSTFIYESTNGLSSTFFIDATGEKGQSTAANADILTNIETFLLLKPVSSVFDQ